MLTIQDKTYWVSSFTLSTVKVSTKLWYLYINQVNVEQKYSRYKQQKNFHCFKKQDVFAQPIKHR